MGSVLYKNVLLAAATGLLIVLVIYLAQDQIIALSARVQFSDEIATVYAEVGTPSELAELMEGCQALLGELRERAARERRSGGEVRSGLAAGGQVLADGLGHPAEQGVGHEGVPDRDLGDSGHGRDE